MDLLLSPQDALDLLARRLRAARKERGWTQAELAARSLVSVPTIARIERTGHGQLASFARLCAALDRLGDFQHLLAAPEPRTLDELRRRG